MTKKLLYKLVIKLSCAALFLSCTTSPSLLPSDASHQSSKELDEIHNNQILNEEPVTPAVTHEKEENSESITRLYNELVSTVTLTPYVLPSPSIKGSSFKKPFTIKITDVDGLPVADFPITVEYPQSISEGTIQFEKLNLISNDQGLVEFTSPQTGFSCNSVISFYPTPSVEIPELNTMIQRVSLKIPYLVKTNLTAAGGSICLVDFDKQGKAITNNGLTSSAVLGHLIRNGFSTLGNAEFYREVALGDYNALYKEAKKIFGSITSYFIIGTVKYEELTLPGEDGLYYVTLKADIICIDMKDNSELYKTAVEATGSGKTEQSALHTARNEQLAPMLAEKIMYGM